MAKNLLSARESKRLGLLLPPKVSLGSSLISPFHLYKKLKDVVVLEGTWFMPNSGRNILEERRTQGRIPTSQHFDIDVVADLSGKIKLPHMLPDEETMRERMLQANITRPNQPIVVYDRNGWSAQRTWWTLRAFGFSNVAVLDGGFKAWQETTRPSVLPIELGPEKPLYIHRPVMKYRYPRNPDFVVSKNDILADLNAEPGAMRQYLIVDARSQERFDGTAPEPRKGLRSGHIPGSICIPFTRFVDVNTQKMVTDPVELRRIFTEAGVDLSAFAKDENEVTKLDSNGLPVRRRRLVTSCGSGVTAAVLSFALHLLDIPDTALYDGSFAEWGLPGPHPVATKLSSSSSSSPSSSSSSSPSSSPSSSSAPASSPKSKL